MTYRWCQRKKNNNIKQKTKMEQKQWIKRQSKIQHRLPAIARLQTIDEQLQMLGRYPLTPEQIGLLLSALGFDSQTRLYLASHKVYGGEARIFGLRRLFPFMEDKKSLATPKELARVEGKASLMAAVDCYVSIQSDIFISASLGNIENAMAGHRTYLNLKIVKPNMNLLGKLFFNKSLEWREFLQQMYEGLIDRRGQIRERKPKQSIYTYPAPDCIYGIAAISPFLHRLAFDNLPKELQRLRCKVNFQALTFVPHINALEEMFIKRLRYHRCPDEHLREVVDENDLHGFGKYAVLHLRFDKEWNPSKPRYAFIEGCFTS